MTRISKTYDTVPPIDVLHSIDFTVKPGERIAIFGESGAGKSTLLNILGLLDEPSSGEYILGGTNVTHLSSRNAAAVRSQDIGFIFQDFHILGHRTATENLEIKLAINRIPPGKRAEMIDGVLGQVGLRPRRDSLGRLLSGGEKQRLAIARAIMCKPRLLLADEPTGNLDSRNADMVLDLFYEQAYEGVAVVVITHDDRIAQWADRVVLLHDGRLEI